MDIIAAAKTRRDEAEVRYSDLLDKLVRDEPVDQAEALSIIDAAGRTPEDLDREVKTRKRILDLEAIIATDPEVQAELLTHNTETGKRRVELEEQINELSRQLTAEMTEANRKGYIIEIKRKKIRDARIELRQLTAPKEPEGPANLDRHEYEQAMRRLGNLTPQYR